MKKFDLIVSGGTFDHLHNGHKDFLRFQLSQSNNVLLGVTTDSFAVRTREGDFIKPYEERVKELREFLASENFLERVEITPIDSASIPDKFQKHPIQAIAVTENTFKGAELVNKERRESGKKPLEILAFTMTLAEDGEPISSTRIRQGIISRSGKKYLYDELLQKPRAITHAMRSELKNPFGKLIINNDYPFESLDMARVITVGDVATKTFLDRSLQQKVAIIDFVVERQKQFSDIKEHGFEGKETILKVKNPPGKLSPDLFNICQKVIQDKSQESYVIVVEGEEDLAVLPVLLVAPLDFTIFYGQPGEGMVMVVVSEDIKEKAYTYVKRFHEI